LEAKILDMPIYCTTQNAARLGPTVAEVTSLLPTDSTATTEVDKTAFSMMVPELVAQLPTQPSASLTVIIVGIETHICVTQTALDLLRLGHRVYILQDGVSSCNAGERPVALARLAREGCVVTTSESLLFELLGDAKDGHFKGISGLVKETKDDTRAAVEAFCRL
jgi:nicotinamidase-related amidase